MLSLVVKILNKWSIFILTTKQFIILENEKYKLQKVKIVYMP